MAAPSYTTDLTTIATGDLIVDTGTWSESSDAGWDTGGAMVDDQNLYYNNTECVSAQLTKDSNGTGAAGPATILYTHGTAITIPADGAALIHHLWAAPPALNTLANGGVKILAGSDDANFYAWNISGSDTSPAPRGGWANYAINPAVGSPTDTVGTAPATYSMIGMAVGAGQQARGNPHACNAIRYGRCEAIITDGDVANGYATFAGYAAVDNASTARWNLIEPVEGGFKIQGLMSVGTSGTSVDFRDANVSITIRDTLRVTSAFNAIEVNNAVSNVEWTAVQITALGTTSIGSFVAVDNATITKDSCTFTDMGLFTYQSNTSVTNTVYRRCGTIDTGGGAFDGCTLDDSTSATATTSSSPANAALITGTTYNSDGSGNGMEITGTAANITLTDLDFTGYSPTVDADKAIFVNIATGSIELNISGGSGISVASDVRTAGAIVTVVSGAVTVKATAALKDGTPVENARVYLRASDGTGPFPFEESVTITRATTTATVSHTAHGMATNDKIVLEGITDNTADNNSIKQITVTDANSYTYTTVDAGSVSYTGSIVSTFVALSGLTNVSGVLSVSRVYPSNQPLVGWTRKSSVTPFLQEGVLVGTVSSTAGFSGTAVMLADE